MDTLLKLLRAIAAGITILKFFKINRKVLMTFSKKILNMISLKFSILYLTILLALPLTFYVLHESITKVNELGEPKAFGLLIVFIIPLINLCYRTGKLIEAIDRKK